MNTCLQSALKPRRLLINCDDLGMHPSINHGIVDLLRDGTIRSASLMPCSNFYDHAVEILHQSNIGAIGVHLTLTSEYPAIPMRPLSPPRQVSSLISSDGAFHPDVTPQIAARFDMAEVRLELELQIEKVLGSGLNISHFDGHMYCYEPEVGNQDLFEAAVALAKEYRVPLRSRGPLLFGQPTVSYGIWNEYDGVARKIFYQNLLNNYQDEFSEIIIHPARDNNMHAVMDSSDIRHADYQFFKHTDINALARAGGFDIVGWQDVPPDGVIEFSGV